MHAHCMHSRDHIQKVLTKIPSWYSNLVEVQLPQFLTSLSNLHSIRCVNFNSYVLHQIPWSNATAVFDRGIKTKKKGLSGSPIRNGNCLICPQWAILQYNLAISAVEQFFLPLLLKRFWHFNQPIS